MKIEITCDTNLDEIGYCLLENTTPKQFIKWVFETIDRTGDQEEFITLIKKEILKYE